MFRKSNVGKINRLKRSAKAISPVIAALLMIAITVVASLVAYAWITGYIGVTTSKAGKAIQIQSYATDPSTGNLVVYIQNVGQDAVQIKPDGSVYVNNALQRVDGTDLISISPGQTVRLAILSYPWTTGNEVKVKVVAVDGTFTEVTGTGYGSLTTLTSIFSDGFESGDFTAWTGTAGGNIGETRTVQTTIHNSGTHAAEFSLPTAIDWSLGYKIFDSPITLMYARCYVYITALPPSGDELFLGPLISNPDEHDLTFVTIKNNFGTYQWGLGYFTNDGGEDQINYVDASPVPTVNKWICLEIMHKVGSSADGESQLWVNGIDTNHLTGLTNNNLACQRINIQAYNAGGFAVNVYFDDVVVASSYI